MCEIGDAIPLICILVALPPRPPPLFPLDTAYNGDGQILTHTCRRLLRGRGENWIWMAAAPFKSNLKFRFHTGGPLAADTSTSSGPAQKEDTSPLPHATLDSRSPPSNFHDKEQKYEMRVGQERGRGDGRPTNEVGERPASLLGRKEMAEK